MHYNTEHAMSKAAMADLGTIRRELKDDGYYHLRAASAECGWPKRGANAVIWWYAKPVPA